MIKKRTSNKSLEIRSKLLVSATVVALLMGVTMGLSKEYDVQATNTDLEEETIEQETLEDVVISNEYRVKFINYDGEELYNELLPAGTFITEPGVPERIGFTFLGWSPEVDTVVGEQNVEYIAQFVETGGGYATDDLQEEVVIYDNDSNNLANGMLADGSGDFINFLFMVILFLMETVWLHDRRSQQMRRYDAVMNMIDKE